MTKKTPKEDTVQPTAEDTVQPTAEDTVQPTAPSLALQDLVQFAQIIQLSTSRGAFRAEELAEVGNLYNKLIAFLESAGAITKSDKHQEEI